MILLERLYGRGIGGLHDVDLTFAPRERRLIEASPADADALSAALRFALFGDAARPADHQPDALAAVSIVAGGVTYAIERRVGRGALTETTLARVTPAGLAPISGAARVERELDRLFGADLDAMAALIWPPTDLQPLGERLDAVLRAWLGSSRMNLLDASVEVGPDMQDAERTAALHVDLAQAAEAHAAATAQVQRLELDLKRHRVARAVGQLELAERQMDGADAQRARMRGLVERFDRSRARAEGAAALAELLERRDAATQQARGAHERRAAVDRRLADLSRLRSTLGNQERRFASLDQALAALARADAAAAAAERTQRTAEAIGEDVAALERALHDLTASSHKAERLTADAERAHELSAQAQDDAQLPAAHRLWNEWLQEAEAAAAAGQAHDYAEALENDLAVLRTARIQQTRAARNRSSQLRLAAGGAAAGAAAGLLGLAAVPPLAPVGLIVGAVGAVAGIVVTRGQRAAAAEAEDLGHQLAAVELRLRNANEWLRTAQLARVAQQRTARQLESLGLEVPAAEPRAVELRDRAEARLLELADGDNRRSADDLRAAWTAASDAAAAAMQDVRRLEARVEALRQRDPQQRMTNAAANRRTLIGKAADARRGAERLAAALGVEPSRQSLTEARQDTQRAVQAMQRRLRQSADLEQRRLAAIHGHAQAADALASLDAEIRRQTSALEGRGAPGTVERPRAVQLAQAAILLAGVGRQRAQTEARASTAEWRSARAARQRHAADLAAALHAMDIAVGADPTAAEARAAVPDLDARPVDADAARQQLSGTRQTARQTEARLRTLELRTGVERRDVDAAEARARLARAVRTRRVREVGRTLVDAALDAALRRLPRAVEHELRATLPLASAGRFWDARVTSDLRVDVWDSMAGVWRAPQELDDDQRERVERALALAFVTAAPPLDAADLPAFVWLQQSAADRSGAALHALAAALQSGAAAQRVPQLIAAVRPAAAGQARFDRVTRVAAGRLADAEPDARQKLHVG